MKLVPLSLLLMLGLSSALFSAFPQVPAVSVETDDDDELLELGELAFRNDCLMCHGSQMVEQQRLTTAQWKAEIQKMITQGATVASEDHGPLQYYLERSFGTSHTVKPPRDEAARIRQTQAMDAADPLEGTDTAAGGRIYAEQCAKCHGADARGGEPGQNLVDQISLLHIEPFDEVVANGRRKMPGFKEVLSPRQVNNVLAWLRTLRYEPWPARP